MGYLYKYLACTLVFACLSVACTLVFACLSLSIKRLYCWSCIGPTFFGQPIWPLRRFMYGQHWKMSTFYYFLKFTQLNPIFFKTVKNVNFQRKRERLKMWIWNGAQRKKVKRKKGEKAISEEKLKMKIRLFTNFRYKPW